MFRWERDHSRTTVVQWMQSFKKLPAKKIQNNNSRYKFISNVNWKIHEYRCTTNINREKFLKEPRPVTAVDVGMPIILLWNRIICCLTDGLPIEQSGTSDHEDWVIS